MSVGFMAACNDWHNGMPLERFEHAEITRNPLGLIAELKHMPTTVSSANGVLRIGRLRVPYLNYRQWVGNWCWDSWLISEKAASQIINYLIQKRSGQCIGGECEIADLINAKHIIVASNLRERQLSTKQEGKE